MGMSSSQARMLTLTARLHDIELRAQRIQAEKLRLANDADKVYNTYLEALEAKKLQYKTVKNDGSIEYRDANLKIMENRIVPSYFGETASETLFLQDMDGKIVVTPEVATKYNLTATGNESRPMDQYIHDITGKNKIRVYGEHYVDDLDHMNGFNAIDIIKTKDPKYDLATPTPAYNTVTNGVYNVDWTSFQEEITEQAPTVTTWSHGSVVANSGEIYQIGTIAQLEEFRQLTGAQTAGNTFVLTADLDVSSAYSNWDGITGFAGTFNGNGHKIIGLQINDTGIATGSTHHSTGFIRTATSTAVVKNVALENANVKAQYANNSPVYAKFGVAALVGFNYGLIENCWVTGNVESQKGHLGAISGSNSGIIKYTNAYATVKTTGTDSQHACVGTFVGCNGSEGSGTIDHCNVGGSITNNYVGTAGLAGHNCGATVIKDSYSEARVINIGNPSDKGGIVLGETAANLSTATIQNVAYDKTINTGMNVTGDAGNIGSIAEVREIKCPSIKADGTGGFYSNIVGALAKSGIDKEDIPVDKIKTYVNALKGEGALTVVTANEYICDYLDHGTSTGFITDLINDINDESIENTTKPAYTCSYSSMFDSFGFGTSTTDSWDAYNSSMTPGEITIPSINTIKDELYCAMRKNGYNITETEVETWLNRYTTTLNDTNKIYLANIAKLLYEHVNEGASADALLTAVDNKTDYNSEFYYSSSLWHVNIGGDTTITPSYEQKLEKDMSNYVDKWDTSDPEVVQAMAMWKLAQRGVIIATEDQASSKEYIINMLQAGGVLTTFDPSKISEFENLSEEELKDMDDYAYNKLVGIENTSVSVNTSVREVENEVNVKKAEAQYEADMKRIDRKDARYDGQLAACENERNAVKSEIDTLKNVIKDNVDKTFKLFS